jgi:hypothetical protein
MRIVEHETLISAGAFPDSDECKALISTVRHAIESMVWPPGADSFTLFEQSGKKRGEGNGVKPIKAIFMTKLEKLGWSLETEIDIATLRRPGPIDASIPCKGRLFCVEWETGNVSSSHRALNKLSLGLLHEVVGGGILILPTRTMYRYLTDRVGNYSEIAPYFPLWRALPVEDGYLAVIAIEHDRLSKSVRRFPKGTDGRAEG